MFWNARPVIGYADEGFAPRVEAATQRDRAAGLRELDRVRQQIEANLPHSAFVGPQIFRTKEKSTSLWDWGDLRLSRSIHFYHRETDTEYRFRTKAVRVKHKVENGLPVFLVRGRDDEKTLDLRIRAYARAYWRFQQPRRWGMKSILYYNEYPSTVEEFRFSTRDGGVRVEKSDLGESACNTEHTWGKLI